MKAGWRLIELHNICRFENGDRGENYPSKSAQTTSGIPFINAGHLTDDGIDFSSMNYISKERFNLLGNGKIQPNDFLFCLRGSLGKFACVDNLTEGAIASSLVIVRPTEQVLRGFLSAYFQSDICVNMIEKYKNGAAQPNLSAGNLKKFLIPQPPLPEQQRIVAILDKAFEAIDAVRSNTEQSLQNAHSLFESYIQSVFNKRDDGWSERKIGEQTLLSMIDGDRGSNYPKTTDFLNHGPCLFLNTKNVRPDGFVFNSTMYISAEKDAQLRKGKLQRNDVVMTTRGTIGNIGLYSDDVPFDNIRINSGMLIFRPNQKEILPAYLFEILRSGIVKEQIRKYTTGAAQPQLPIKTLVNFSIPVPTDLAVQAEIVEKVREFEPQIQRLEALYQRKIAALDELKKSLLQQAFSGEL